MIILQLLLFMAVPAGASELLAVFWNVENFFDYRSDAGPKYWTRGRFYTKCDAVAKTLLEIADEYGRIPDIIGFAELENGFVLHSIVNSTQLRRLGYKAVHFDSPDHRGIDCGLLYLPGLDLVEAFPVHVYDSAGAVMATRDILVAVFDSLAVLVNHHPSKIGGKSDRREAAMARMNAVADSLLAAGNVRVIAMGDFNEVLWEGEGTLKYNGRWEKIDGCFTFGDISVEDRPFADPLLLTRDKAFGGTKPRRTFIGPRYEGGVSDHLPLVMLINF